MYSTHLGKKFQTIQYGFHHLPIQATRRRADPPPRAQVVYLRPSPYSTRSAAFRYLSRLGPARQNTVVCSPPGVERSYFLRALGGLYKQHLIVEFLYVDHEKLAVEETGKGGATHVRGGFAWVVSAL